jgi:hypothetical protein
MLILLGTIANNCLIVSVENSVSLENLIKIGFNTDKEVDDLKKKLGSELNTNDINRMFDFFSQNKFVNPIDKTLGMIIYLFVMNNKNQKKEMIDRILTLIQDNISNTNLEEKLWGIVYNLSKQNTLNQDQINIIINWINNMKRKEKFNCNLGYILDHISKKELLQDDRNWILNFIQEETISQLINLKISFEIQMISCNQG